MNETPIIVLTVVVFKGEDDELRSFTMQNNCRINTDGDWEEIRRAIGMDNLKTLIESEGFTPHDVVYMSTLRIAKPILDTYLKTIAGLN